MYVVDEVGGTEVGVARGKCGVVLPDDLLRVFLQRLYLLTEVAHKILVWLEVVHVHERAVQRGVCLDIVCRGLRERELLRHDEGVAVVIAEIPRRRCHVLRPRAWIQHGGIVTCDVEHLGVGLAVVVSVEDDVEAWRVLGNGVGSILLHQGILHLLRFLACARVEHAHDDVRLFLHLRHVLACRRHHVLELHAAPKVLWQPLGNYWRQQSEYGDAQAALVDDDVGLPVWIPVLIDHVGSQYGEVALPCPAVIYGVSRLDVVVADYAGVVLHVVHDFGT